MKGRIHIKKVILSNIKQGIFSVPFTIGVASFVMLFFVSSLESIVIAITSAAPLPRGFHTTIIQRAFNSDVVTFFTPIVAVLPMAATYIDDLKSHFIRHYLSRVSRKAYILGRICGVVISGGLVVLFGILLAYAISSLLFLPMERVANNESDLVPGLKDIVLSSLLFLISGGFWALVGLSMSTLIESKYVAYATPFIIYYILLTLYERYFPSLFVLSPKEWLVPTKEWFCGSCGPAVIVVELTIIMALLFAINAEKRLWQL